MFRKDIEKSSLPEVAVTVPHKKKQVEALAKATKAGPRSLATGGEHLCTDDCFKATKFMERNAKIKQLLKEKKERQAAEQREAAALAILQVNQ